MDIENMIIKFIVNLISIISVVYVVVGIKFLRDKQRNSMFFSLLMFACAIYSFGYFFEINSTNSQIAFLIRNFEYLGVVFIPAFGILFIMQITKINEPKTKIKALLYSFSAILWLLYVSNPFHALFYRSVDFSIGKYGGGMLTVKGPIYYFLLAYYVLFFIFSSIMLQKAYKITSEKNNKNSFKFLFIAFQLPWITVLFILLGLDMYIDPAPFTIMLVNGLFAVNELKNDMFGTGKILREAENERKLLLENIQAGIVVHLADTTISSCNNIAEKLLGLSITQMQGKVAADPYWRFVSEDGEPISIEDYPVSKVLQNKKHIAPYVLGAITSKLTSRRWFLVNGYPIFDKNKKVEKVVVTFFDISERKEIEEKHFEQKVNLEKLLNTVPSAVYTVDSNMIITSWNKRAEVLTGYSESEVLGKDCSLFALDPCRKKCGLLAQDMTKPLFNKICTIKTKSGEIIHISKNVDGLYDVNGNIVGGIECFEDIEDKIKNEKNLINSETNFRIFFNSIDDFLFVLDEQGNMINVNDTVINRLGYLENELIGQNVLMVHPKDKRDEVGEIVGEMLAGTTELCDIPIITKSGQLIEVETRVYPGTWNGNVALFGVTKDVTKIKQTEERFSKAFQAGSSLMAISEIESGLFIDVNESFLNTTGYLKNEVIGKKANDLNLFENNEDRLKTLRIVKETGFAKDIEVKIKVKNGEARIGLFSITTINIRGTLCWLTTMTDITERKKTEEQLKDSELRYNIAVEGTGTGIWDWDMIKDEVVFSIQWKAMLGYEDNEVENSFSGWKNLWHPDDAASIEKALNDHLAGKTAKYEVIHRCRHKDGDWRWIITRGTILKDSTNKPYRWVGTNVNITAIKEIEKALENNSKLQQLIIEISAIFVKTPIEADINAHINNSIAKIGEHTKVDRCYIFEYDFDNSVCNNTYEWCATGIEPQINNLQDVPFSVMSDWVDIHKKGEIIYIQNVFDLPLSETREVLLAQGIKSLLAIPISFKGECFGFIGFDSVCSYRSFSNDEQKLLEMFSDILINAMERNNLGNIIFLEKEQFKTTLYSVGDGVISVDTQGNVLIMNKVSENLTGWTQEEAFGKPMEEVFYIINEYTRERCENPVSKVLETGNIIELANHTILISKNGTERPIEDSAAPIKDEQGNTVGVVLVFRDFTDKKQKQEQIEFLSYYDQLTGLHNRRYYEQEIARLNDERYYPLTLVMADVNGLKLTNDAFGHKSGDLLLQRISSVLKRECRENDIVARIGGDEFVLLLPETDAENAEIIINRINTAIKNEKNDNVILSISIGYAVKQDYSEHIDEVFMKAEDDMYRHKLSESSSMRSKTIDLIMNTLFEKNSREKFHSERVGEISKAIAEKMSFTKENVEEIKLAGLMHDIGKIGIAETILNKPDKLNDNDWDEVKRHSEIGYRILSSVNEFSQVANFILEHHERIDGSGYPKGLKGDEISLQARIIAVADSYDAMTKERTYRKALSKEEAIAELKRCSGKQFDPEVVKVFIENDLETE